MLDHVHALPGKQVQTVRIVRRIIHGLLQRVWHVQLEVQQRPDRRQGIGDHVHALLGTQIMHVGCVRRIIDGMDPRVWHVKTEVQ